MGFIQQSSVHLLFSLCVNFLKSLFSPFCTYLPRCYSVAVVYMPSLSVTQFPTECVRFQLALVGG